ncbi:protein-ER retention protein [Savitreella phatthalungensis]
MIIESLTSATELVYRPPFLVALGVFLYGTNLTLLRRLDLPTGKLLNLGTNATHASYYVAIAWLCIIAACFLFSLPQLMFPGMLLILAAPGFVPVAYVRERYDAVKQLARLSIGGISARDGDKFLDIVVADVLTSYARVFGDLVLLLGLNGRFFAAVAISYPYLIRLRQCLIEHSRSGSSRHLANAAKYSTAFPVIIISALQGEREAGGPVGSYVSDKHLRAAWLVACAVNSTYALWWDIHRDWDFRLPRLRARMTFSKVFCYAAIFADTLLRFSWLVKLIVSESDVSIFSFELIELMRRWVWIFLRVECEYWRNDTQAEELREVSLP